MVIIFAESRLDFKYTKFLGHLTENYILVTFNGLIKLWLKKLHASNNYYFHVRYLKWRGPVLTILYYLLVVLLCSVRDIKLVFTCHNYWEHNFNNRFVNAFIRKLLVRNAHAVIVLDDGIGERIALGRPNLRKKIHTVHFSSFIDYFEKLKTINKDFSTGYTSWKTKRGIDKPDVVLISASYRSLDRFRETFNNSIYNYLCIVPKVSNAQGFGENTLIFNEGFVEKEVTDLLREGGIIGMIGLDNGSIATSLYMFASYNIPMLVLNEMPMNALVADFKIGHVFDLLTSVDEQIELIKKDYTSLGNNCSDFLKAHSWQKSHDIHCQIFH